MMLNRAAVEAVKGAAKAYAATQICTAYKISQVRARSRATAYRDTASSLTYCPVRPLSTHLRFLHPPGVFF
jgi:hypothetical protein